MALRDMYYLKGGESPETIGRLIANIVTEYDRKLKSSAAKRGQRHNIYALSHYLRAANNVVESLENGKTLRDSLKSQFVGALLRHVAKRLGTNYEFDKRD
jgi:hypothetical protein